MHHCNPCSEFCSIRKCSADGCEAFYDPDYQEMRIAEAMHMFDIKVNGDVDNMKKGTIKA